jgi:16S rRNA (guanine527-N7)-methyltransferase
MPTAIERFSQALRERAIDFGVQLRDGDLERLGSYYELLLKWNPRLHLVAPCSPREFATRHILESLVLLPHLTSGARVTDVGSGGGLPIVPCLIMRADLRGTLIESSPKKGVFLHEAIKQLRNPPQLIVNRFEEISAPATDFVTCRALDQFPRHLSTLIEWAPRSSTLLLFVGAALRERVEGVLPGVDAELIPGSERRFLVIARRNEEQTR